MVYDSNRMAVLRSQRFWDGFRELDGSILG